MLTRRRNSLLYEIRKLKRMGSIFQYWTDFTGAITLKKDEGGLKTRITAINNKKDFSIRTYIVSEVIQEFDKKQKQKKILKKTKYQKTYFYLILPLCRPRSQLVSIIQ